MTDAFTAAYPARWSWWAKLLYPTVHPMTFVRAIHLGLMFPLGIASFVFLVVTLAVGGSLIWTLIGPLVLLLGLYISRWFADLEAWRVRHVAGIELRRPPTGIERGQSFRQQVKTRLIDPSTWTGLVYLFLQFPIGIAAFVGLIAGGALVAAFIGAPFYATQVDSQPLEEAVRVSIDLGFWSGELTEPGDIALALVPLGVLIYFVLVHAINIATALHASWARLMLGSRADPILLAPTEAPPPAAPTDEPPRGGLDEPDTTTMVDGDPVAPALEETESLPLSPPEHPTTAPPDRRDGPVTPSPALPTGPPPADMPASPAPGIPGEAEPRIPDAVAAVAEPAAPLRLGLGSAPRETEVATPPSASQLVPELDAPLLVATVEPLDALTTREREVLTLIARGYSNAAIAETFVISEGTVKTHVKRVLSKLGLRDRTQAAIYAYETSFVVAGSTVEAIAPEPIPITRSRAR